MTSPTIKTIVYDLESLVGDIEEGARLLAVKSVEELTNPSSSSPREMAWIAGRLHDLTKTLKGQWRDAFDAVNAPGGSGEA